MQSTLYDIVIAGYGPAGAMAANLLGQRGYRVAVLDRALEIYDKPRAITADHEVMRVLQECGLADRIEPRTVPHPGTDFVGVDGQIIKRFYPQPPPNPLGWEPTWMFFQPELEAILREGVARFDRVDVFLGHEVVGLTQTPSSATLSATRVADGVPVTVSGRYVLACDGARSFFRRHLGVAIDDLAFDEWWIVLDAFKRHDTELPPRMRQYCRPSRPGTYIVGPGDLRRWEIKILPDETPEMFEDLATVAKAWSDFVDVSAFELCRTAIYRFHALLVEDWQVGRVFLAGDAAHQMPPFLGQGLCAAIRDVYNLVWKIDAVERGGALPAILETYGAERKPHVRTVVSHAKDFGLIIGELDLTAARARDARLEALMASGQAETVRQKFIPGLVGGLTDRDAEGQAGLGAGMLFVQPFVRSAARWQRLDDVTGARFVLATCDASAVAGFDAETARLWNALGGVTVLVKPDGSPLDPAFGAVALVERDRIFTDWMQGLGAKAVIVRPDRYVFGAVGETGDLQGLIRRLCAQMFGGQDAS